MTTATFANLAAIAQGTTVHDAFFSDPQFSTDPPETRNHLTAGYGGVWLGRTPASVWHGKSPAFEGWCERIVDRAYQRVVGLNLKDPTLNLLKTNALGLNVTDAEHFSIRLLSEIARCPTIDEKLARFAGQLALGFVSVWWTNTSQGDYLRDGGNQTTPYSSNGRLRKAGAIFGALADVLRLFKFYGAHPSYVEMAHQLIGLHVGLVTKHWPLTAAPKGDHLPCPHLEVFQLGVCASGALELNDALMDTTGKTMPELHQIGRAACALAQIAFTGSSVYYDLPVIDGVATIENLPPDVVKYMKPQQAAGSTHVWVADALTRLEDKDEATYTMLDWQRDRAIAAGWTEQEHPWQCVRWFGGWQP